MWGSNDPVCRTRAQDLSRWGSVPEQQDNGARSVVCLHGLADPFQVAAVSPPPLNPILNASAQKHKLIPLHRSTKIRLHFLTS